ncbi:unnamed protein product, partial [Discosporangium mesarthrocarpum]
SSSKVGISRAGGSRSRAGISAHASGFTGPGGGSVRVMYNGINVTPQSLLSSSRRQSTSGGAGAKPLPEKRRSRSKGLGAESGRSALGSSAQDSRGEAKLDSAISNNASNRLPTRRKREGMTEDGGFTEEDLSAPIPIRLCETPTEMLLEIRGSAVATDLRDYDRYQHEKQEYDKKVAERIGSDKYTSHHAQTVNWAQKTKEVMAAAAVTKDVSCTANTWEIFDEQAKGIDVGAGDDGVYGDIGSKVDAGKVMSDVQKQASELATVTLASPGCLLETNSTVAPPPLPQNAAADHSGRTTTGALSGSGIVNPNSSRARANGGGGEGGGGGGGGGGRGGVHGKGPHLSQSSMVSKTSMGRKIEGGEEEGRGGGEGTTGPIDARGVAEVLASQQAEEIMVSKELLKSLELVERSLFQNFLHAKQLLYRNYPPVGGISGPKSMEGMGGAGGGGGGEAGGEGKDGTKEAEMWECTSTGTKDDSMQKRVRLQKLWTHEYPFADGCGSGSGRSRPGEGAPTAGRAPHSGSNSGTSGGKAGAGAGVGAGIPRKDRTVTALCFHQLNGDVLAVGYGDFLFSPKHQGGAVLFWSVRNPEYPERVVRTHSSVTSLDFSERHPNLLAVGMYDGTIAIYDTAREGE